MTPVFADTAYYLALLNDADELHASAVALTGKIPDRIVTTAWILVELANAMCCARHRELVTRFIRDLRADDRVTIVAPSWEEFDRGFRLFAERPDKDWSLTDCISFVIMQDSGLTDALTSDHHFEQAGFAVLLK